MTGVRGRRGRLVHAWQPLGARRDLCPDDVPSLVCGKKLKGAVITDESVDCDVCLSIIWEGN
jgi:hypothetical protein